MSKRDEYLKKTTINLSNYYKSIGESLNSKINQLSYLLGNFHHLSVGNYKENLLKEEIKKFLPKNYSIGTGFVLFPIVEIVDDKKYIKKTMPSKQLDIIIYDNTTVAPLFKDNDFVILPPECVIAIIEVKGFMNNKYNPLDIYEDYCEKWQKYLPFVNSYLGYDTSSDKAKEKKAPKFCFYSLDKHVNNNNSEITAKNFVKKIKSGYNKILNKYSTICNLNSFFPSVLDDNPWFIGAYIYKTLVCDIGMKGNSPNYSIVYSDLKEDEEDISFAMFITNLLRRCKIPTNFNLTGLEYNELNLAWKEEKIYNVTTKEIYG